MSIAISKPTIALELNWWCSFVANLNEGEKRRIRQRLLIVLLELAEQAEIVDYLGDVEEQCWWLALRTVESVDCVDSQREVLQKHPADPFGQRSVHEIKQNGHLIVFQ